MLCLTPLSTIFQIYHCGFKHLYWLKRKKWISTTRPMTAIMIALSTAKRIHKEDWQQDVMCIYIRWLCIMCPNYILQYRLSSQYDNANVLNQCIALSPNLCIIPCNIKMWWCSNERPCICVHFASFNDCDIWFWNCSDSVVFFCFSFYFKMSSMISPF